MQYIAYTNTKMSSIFDVLLLAKNLGPIVFAESQSTWTVSQSEFYVVSTHRKYLHTPAILKTNTITKTTVKQDQKLLLLFVCAHAIKQGKYLNTNVITINTHQFSRTSPLHWILLSKGQPESYQSIIFKFFSGVPSVDACLYSMSTATSSG